jgi:hypothetical protein
LVWPVLLQGEKLTAKKTSGNYDLFLFTGSDVILASQWYSFFTLFSFRYVVCWQDTVRESFRAKFCVSLVWPVLLQGYDVILALI